MPSKAITVDTAMVVHSAASETGMGSPTAGANQATSGLAPCPPQSSRSPGGRPTSPARAAPTAKIASGRVIAAGASWICSCTAALARQGPVNTRK